jgi:hypothetical protein
MVYVTERFEDNGEKRGQHWLVGRKLLLKSVRYEEEGTRRWENEGLRNKQCDGFSEVTSEAPYMEEAQSSPRGNSE